MLNVIGPAPRPAPVMISCAKIVASALLPPVQES